MTVRFAAVSWKRNDEAGGTEEFKVLAGGTGGPKSRWFDPFDLAFRSPECDRRVQGFPVRNPRLQHEAAELLPEAEQAPGLFACLSEQPAASLLDLIDEEGEHHQVGQNVRQVPVPVAEIGFEVVALVFGVLRVSFSMRYRARPARVIFMAVSGSRDSP